MERLHFLVDGASIVKLAQSKFYDEHDLKSAIDLIWHCTIVDNMSAADHLRLCLDIICGYKTIVGVYPEDSYGVIKTDSDSDIQKFIQEVATCVAKSYGLEEQFSLNNDEASDQSPASYMLSDFLKQCKSGRDDDYGWLAPDGTFYPVEWGEHSEWAKEYADKHYPFKDYAHMYWKTDAEGHRHHYVCGDFLVYVLGWALLDNPHQGASILTYDKSRGGLTKHQKDFLYDYYMQRNRFVEANNLYKEEDMI